MLCSHHYSTLEAMAPTPVLLPGNPMDGGAWWAAVLGVARSRTRLSDFTLTFHFHALKEEMATHSSVLAWRIPWTEEPGGLLSMGSHRVGHDWSDLAAAAATLFLIYLWDLHKVLPRDALRFYLRWPGVFTVIYLEMILLHILEEDTHSVSFASSLLQSIAKERIEFCDR